MADLGQVFTKGNVAQYMVSLFDLAKEAKIMDPCYGAGSFLDALASSEYSKVEFKSGIEIQIDKEI